MKYEVFTKYLKLFICVVLLVSFFTLLAHCEDETGDVMYDIEVYAQINDQAKRDQAANYLNGQSTTTVLRSIEKKRVWQTDPSTGTVIYLLHYDYRFPKALKSKREEVKETIRTWIQNNNAYIMQGYIKVHICYNNDLPGRSRKCRDICVWSKNMGW